MKSVEPIRDIEKVYKCYEIARAHDKKRCVGGVSWELLLQIGFNTSLRISDLKRLKVKDIRDQSRCNIKAKKTGKEANILINPASRRELNRLLSRMNDDDYILQSRNKDPADHGRKSISRQRAWQIMNRIAREAGITERIGCHTLRKTFGYWYYKSSENDIATLQKILGHTSRRDTLVYIGVVQEDMDESLRSFTVLSGRRKY